MSTDFCKKYRKAARTILPIVKESMKMSSDRPIIYSKTTVDINMDIIKNRLGGEFPKKYSFTIYWGLKCGLFKEGYYAESYNKKEDNISIRKKKITDVLPPSLDYVCNC